MIPDLDALVERVLREAPLREAPFRNSMIHGEGHWKCVAHTGASLVRLTVGADPIVVFLFALLHDSQRRDDGHDAEHGPRAASYARTLQGEAFQLADPQLRQLTIACHDHTRGGISGDPTIGVCWDSDRLNLWRLGVRPLERLLSTAAARQARTIDEASRFAGQSMSWSDIYALYPTGT